MSKVWEPIIGDRFVACTCGVDGCRTAIRVSETQSNLFLKGREHSDIYGTAIVLPHSVRLCRLVDAPDAANAQPVQPTAQEFYDEWIRRYMDASKQRGDPYQIARDIAIELGIKETHDA